MGIIDDWLIQRYMCPKCMSRNTEKTEYHKQAFDGKKGQRREHVKYICKDCKHEFWK